MVTQLYLLRHGPTVVEDGSLVGSSDVPVSGKGFAHLSSLVRVLNSMDAWYCSPLIRARQTMDKIKTFGVSIADYQIEPKLQEINFGRWELKTFKDIASDDPEAVIAWQEYSNFVFPGGESIHDFTSRVQCMLDTFVNSEHQRIGIISHGGVIRTMICLALGISSHNYLLFDVKPASLTILTLYDQGAVLNGLNVQGQFE